MHKLKRYQWGDYDLITQNPGEHHSRVVCVHIYHGAMELYLRCTQYRRNHDYHEELKWQANSYIPYVSEDRVEEIEPFDIVDYEDTMPSYGKDSSNQRSS
jgi:hypothetical protein